MSTTTPPLLDAGDLSVEEAAEPLRMRPERVEQACAAGLIASRPGARGRRIPAVEVERILSNRARYRWWLAQQRGVGA